jgi:hypothetical protein
VKENTMNLSKHLCVDKELFSGTNVKENTIIFKKYFCNMGILYHLFFQNNLNIKDAYKYDILDIILLLHNIYYNEFIGAFMRR